MTTPAIETILGAFGASIFGRDHEGNLYKTKLEPVIALEPEFDTPTCKPRKALSQAMIHPDLFTWEPSDADGGNAHRFDTELRMATRQRFNW